MNKEDVRVHVCVKDKLKDIRLRFRLVVDPNTKRFRLGRGFIRK